MDEQLTRDPSKSTDSTRSGGQQSSMSAGSGSASGGSGAGNTGIGSTGNTSSGNTGAGTGNSTVDQAVSVAREVGEQAKNMMASAGSRAQDLARQARDQASPAIDSLYQQGARAGEYITRSMDEYPIAALVVAGAIGYGLAYLIHNQWSSSDKTRGRNVK